MLRVEAAMPRTPKQTDGQTGPAKPKRVSTENTGSNGTNDDISPAEVERRAYELYQARGGQHGADFDDWLEAEKQIKQNQQPPAPAERRKRSRTAGA
jgi:hypothetical protein